MGGTPCARRRQQAADEDPHGGPTAQDAAVQTPELRSPRPELLSTQPPRSTRPEELRSTQQPRSTRPELRSMQQHSGGADAWARLTRRLQRLAYKRRAWAFLGHLLRDIKDRGRR